MDDEGWTQVSSCVTNMAYKILNTCTACGECVDSCPVDAIEPGDPIYVIGDTCVDFQECLAMCDVDAIVLVEKEKPGRSDSQNDDGKKTAEETA